MAGDRTSSGAEGLMMRIEDERDTKSDQFGLVQVNHVPTGTGNQMRRSVALRRQFTLEGQPKGLEGVSLRGGWPAATATRDDEQRDLGQGRCHAHGARTVPETQ